jgi:hypothetical protein
MIRVLLPICDRHLWALKPFSYLFNTFWSEQQEVIVAGFKTPDFDIPPNFKFRSIAPEDPGPQHWSDQLLEALNHIEDEYIVLMLEDYWLCRGMDLTTDRLYAGGMFEVDRFGCYDIVETKSDTPYQMSTQAGIWNRVKLYSILESGKSPWEVELQTKIPEAFRVLGSRQWPVRYSNVFNSGKGDEMQQLDLMPKEQLEYMKSKGWIK